MSRCLKTFMTVSCLFALSFMFTHLEAAYGRWGAYNNERGAWGGNGGWWGDNRNDWYGDYGTPEENLGYGNYNGYYYDNNYPYYGQYYGNSVDGAGVYFNVR